MTAARVRPAIRSKIGIPLFAKNRLIPPSRSATRRPARAAKVRAAIGRRLRLALDRSEHAGRLPLLRRQAGMALCRPAAGRRAFRLRRIGRRGRAIRAGRAPGRRPSLRGAHRRGVAAFRHPRALDSRRAARRERGRRARDFVGRGNGIDAGDARDMGGTARSLWPRPRSLRPRDNILAGTAYLREMFDRYGNVAAMLAAYNAGPGRYDEHRATGRPLPAETRAYIAALARSSAARLQPNRRHRHRHRRPIGARHRCSSCVRATRGLSPRRRSRCKQATAALPFRRATPPVRSRRATAFSSPTRAVRERHEDGVPALGGAHSGVQSGRFSPGRLPGRRGRKGRKGGGQD